MNKQLKLTNYDILASILFIGTIIVSILISYNNKLKLEKKTPLFDVKLEKEILIFNKIIVLFIVIFFLYLNYERLRLAEEKNLDTKTLKIQLIPSILALISAIIILSLVLKNGNNDISLNENAEF